jgi:hypothetical protein
VLRVISVVLIAVLAAGAGLVGLAGVANASAPGDLLYGLDLAAERVNLALAATPEQAMEVQVAIAAERLEEVQSLLARGDSANADAAMAEFEQSLAVMSHMVTGATGSTAEQAGLSMDAAFEPAVVSDEEPDEFSLYCENGAYISDAPEHPVALRLAAAYEVEVDEIMAWFCQGYGFGEIKLAYAAAERTEYTVEEIFALRAEGLGWGEVWNVIGLISHPGKDAKGETEVPEEGEPDEEEEQGVCASDSDHPHGQQLAAGFGVDYAEIMAWFCQGYGFGEIKLAYSISQKMEIEVEAVFALRQSGLGWGEIMQEYGLNGSDLKPNKPNGKPEDKPNGKPENPGNKP